MASPDVRVARTVLHSTLVVACAVHRLDGLDREGVLGNVAGQVRPGSQVEDLRVGVGRGTVGAGAAGGPSDCEPVAQRPCEFAGLLPVPRRRRIATPCDGQRVVDGAQPRRSEVAQHHLPEDGVPQPDGASIPPGNEQRRPEQLIDHVLAVMREDGRQRRIKDLARRVPRKSHGRQRQLGVLAVGTDPP